MKSRLVAFVVLAAALLLAGAGCHSRIWPVIDSAPDTVAAGEVATIVVRTEQSARRAAPLWVNYAIRWGDDSSETTTDYFLSTDTVQFTHTWTRAGTFHVWIENSEDVRNANGTPGTRKAVPVDLDITVTGNGLPLIDTVLGPPVAVRGVEAFFTVKAHDPDGDSIRTFIDWGDSTGTTTGFSPSPCSTVVSHTFWLAETARVVTTVQDYGGAPSLPETIYVLVGTGGADAGR